MRAHAFHFEGAALVGGRPAYLIAREMRRVLEQQRRLSGGGSVPADLAEALEALEAAGRVWIANNQPVPEVAVAAEGPAGSAVVECGGRRDPSTTVTTREAASLLGVSERRVRQLVSLGSLPARRARGGHWAIDRACLAEYERIRDAG